MPSNHEKSYVPALGFHFLTPAYDVVVRLTTRERAFKSALIQQARIEGGYRVLDLACGTGTLAIAMKRQCPNAEILGIDGDSAMLEIARSKVRTAQVAVAFDQGLSFALPYPEGHFDRVASSLFFHHLSWPDKVRTALELHRVLRPGGELHVADWGRASGPVSPDQLGGLYPRHRTIASSTSSRTVGETSPSLSPNRSIESDFTCEASTSPSFSIPVLSVAGTGTNQGTFL